ncbi:MAG TPA: carbonic anhydrase [Firmicutes bacterium]|jgi:carbonic anhydrase|nr:carbonic anhydrase [Bacillota bacterium]
MDRLMPVNKIEDIPEKYANTPVKLLLEYQNFNRKNDNYQKAQLLIAMCMDHRKYLRIPPNFAYMIRTGGGNLRFCDFFISYAISIGKISAIVLIAHNDCGMANLFSVQEQFVEGLVQNAGWDHQQATEHFLNDAPLFEIGNEIDFVLSETARLRIKYPKVPIIPLFYRLEDHLLYGIQED